MNSPDQKALQASRRIHEASFPGIEGLAAVAAGAAVLARRRDGSEVAGRLGAFDGRDGRIEIERDGATERLAFDELQWLKLVEPTDPSRSADAFRGAGIPVESLPSVSPFGIAFTNGQVLGGELHGYGAALGGLGVYLAQEDGQATRLFIPAGAIESFTVGERLGKLLLERGQITADGLELALERQRALRKQTLGELLLHQRLISRGDLEKALAGQGAKPVQRLGEVLVEMGILDRTQLDTALGAQRANRRKPLGEILLELQMIDRETLESVLAQKLGIPFVDLRRFAFDTNWADLAPYPVCRDHAIVPLYRAAGTTVVALANPLDIENLNVVSFAIGTPVQPVLASSADIAWGIERHPERRLYETMEEAAAATPEAEDAETLASQLGREFGGAQAEQAVEQRVNPGDSTLVRLVNKIIADAYHQKASDIHFEPGNGHERLRVRFRRDGALFDYLTLSSRFRPAIISRLKIMASLDITDHRHAQDGKIDCRRFGGLPLELRMAVIPTVGGFESVVLRLLAAATALPFEKIGLAEEDLARLKALAEKPYGLILVCGPTGSGKTTTLHSVLRHVNKPDTKIWTAEDPVEITQAGLNQVQVHPAIGWTFATALRSFLRADPDVIMIGEVRDAETARICVESSLTGHLVLSTLHTNSAAESVVRLVDIGIDPFNFADALLGVLAQRLTRRLCARCSVGAPVAEDTLAALAAEYCFGTQQQPAEVLARWRAERGEALRIGRPVGCKVCSGLGYAGRIALFELLVASPGVKRLMLRQGTVEQIRTLALQEGMRTLKQDGIDKVLRGLTTIEQVRAVAG